MPTLHLHGPPRVVLDDRSALPLAAREAALLAWLHVEGPAPRALLAGLLWPGGGETRARANLRQTISRLRRAAGDLLTEADGMLALAAGVAVAPPGTGAGMDRLLGPLEFDDADDLSAWLQERREAAARERRRERLSAGERRLADGDTLGAIEAADAVLADDPAVEEAHRLRMQALAARGDRAAAIAAWDDCRHALRRAFGIETGGENKKAGRRILSSEATTQTPSQPAAPSLPEALRRPPALVGRDDALRAIASAFAAGRGVLVAGPGGVGKSRLMAEAARALQPAIAVGGRPGDTLQPGALASRLVAAAIERFDPALDTVTQADIQRLLPGGPAHGPVLRSALEHRRVLASVARTMLACHARGMRLVVVDDLQFADDLSMEAIAVVIGGWLADPPATAALPMFGMRPDELRPAAAALVNLLQGSPRGVRIDLAPLDRPALRRLLDQLPATARLAGPAGGGTAAPVAPPVDLDALAAALHARVGGNPAFVLESLRSLWPDALAGWQPGTALPVPATLVASVRQRLGRLGDDALRLAQLASVAQGDFSLAMAASAFGRAPLALAPLFAELEAAQVMDANGFSHDLVAEAVAASLPAPMRPPLHRLVAEHLQAHDGAPQAVAAHWLAAGDARAASRWQLQAADRARDRWRHEEAALAYEAAFDGLDPLAQRAERVRAGREAARCWLWLSRHDRADAVLARAEPLARGAAERTRLGTVRTVLLHNTRRIDEAVRQAHALADGLTAAAALLGAYDINQALRAIAITLPLVGEDALALDVVQRMAGQLDASQPESTVDYRLVRGGLLARIGRAREAVDDLQTAFVDAARLRRHGPQVAIGGEWMRALQSLGRAREALAAGEATLAVVVDGGFGAGFEFELRGQIAMLMFALGQAGPAWRQLDAAEACFERSGRPAHDTMLRAMLRVMAGDTAAAQTLLARHERPQPSGGTHVNAQYFACVQARLARACGRAADEADWLARAQGWGADGIAHHLQLAAAGPAPSRDAAHAWLEQAQAKGLAAAERAARIQLARAECAAGRHLAAADHVRASLQAVDRVDPWLADTAGHWLDAARLLEACGLADDARTARAMGAQWVRRAAATIDDPQRRAAWLDGHQAHRALLTG